jgi:cell division protein FtsB
LFFRGGKKAGADGGRKPPAAQPPAPRRSLRRLLLASVFLAGCAALLFGERGVLDVRRNRRQLKELQSQVVAKKVIVEKLRLEVERLETEPKALERVVREELGMARPGEVIILLPRDPDWGKPSAEGN